MPDDVDPDATGHAIIGRVVDVEGRPLQGALVQSWPGVDPERVRLDSMLNELGQKVAEVGPSMPVSILGLSGTPESGDDVLALADERKVRELAGLLR